MPAFRDETPPQPDGFGLAEAAKGPISAKASGCETLFVNILQIWKSNGEDRYEFVLRKLEKRFLDWAAYLGVFAGGNGRLDQRLERHPQYRHLILMCLEMLHTSLLQVTADPSERDSDDSSDEGVDIRRIELEDIQQSLNELDRIAIRIWHSPASALDSRAMLAVDCLYPKAPESLRRYLSQLMTQTHMKFLYWQSNDQKLRKNRRFDRKSQDGSTQIRQNSSHLLAKKFSPQPSIIDQKQSLPDFKANKIPVVTSTLSETLPSDLDSRYTVPTVDAEMPSPRRAGASTILGSRAKFPDPPKFEDGETLKPCPLCRKNFSEAEFNDSTWWKCHVNEDLLPFVCISSLCIQPPAFARRSDWRAHMQKYHDAGPSKDVCPLCCLPLVEPKESTIDPNDIIESRKSGKEPLRCNVLKHKGKPSGERTAQDELDSDEEPAAHAEKPGVDHMINPMMDHIADHLQFLGLLTIRLSAKKITDGHVNSFSSSQALSSDQGSEKGSTLDDEIEFDREDVSKEKGEHELQFEAPPDVEWPQGEWMEPRLKSLGQEVEAPDTLLLHLYEYQLLQELWSQAYHGLRCDNPELVETYENILSSKLILHRSNHVEQTICFMEKAQERELHQPNQLILEALNFMLEALPNSSEVNKGKKAINLIREIMKKAIQAAPGVISACEGDLILAEVVHRIITNTGDTGKGIAYILSRIEWYRELASLLLDLYNKALTYLMRNICLFHEKLDATSSKSILKTDSWASQFSAIQNVERAVQRDMEQYNVEETKTKFLKLADAASALEMDLQNMRPPIGSQPKDLTEIRKANMDKYCLRALYVADPRMDKIRIEDTAGGLLRDSYCWILENEIFRNWRDCESSRLLWIKGDQGKGKTMLLCGIIDELKPFLISNVREKFENARESFFKDVNTWTTISEIMTAILSDHRLKDAVIVVDALDECTEGLEQLLNFISQASSSFDVKWIVSSRNWPLIEQTFQKCAQKADLHLELNTDSISAAIQTYISHKVQALARKKRCKEEMEQTLKAYLLSNAKDTFLWVALVCRNLDDDGIESRHIIQKLSSYPSNVYDLYQWMLTEMSKVPKDVSNWKQILGFVLTVYRPVTLPELCSLLPGDSPHDIDTVTESVKRCNSFITIYNDTVYFLHQSAKDFLCQTQNTSPLFKKDGIHFLIITQSLLSMKRTLKRDMYSLGAPGPEIDEIEPPNPDPLSAVRYSCVYWIDHLCDYKDRDKEKRDFIKHGVVNGFFRKYFYNWLEALSLLRSMSAGAIAITKLNELVKDLAPDSSAFALVRDSMEFTLRNRWMVESVPLQVYVSAILFSPVERRQAQMIYRAEEPSWNDLKPYRKGDWYRSRPPPEAHSDGINSVVFSSDGQRLASGSSDKTIRIWDATSGVCLQALKSHKNWIISVIFSPDGQLLASGSSDNTIKLWDVKSGACLQTFDGHRNWIISVSFSPNSRLVASGSRDQTVKVWDVNSGDCLQTLEGHKDWITLLAFSHDAQSLASGSKDQTIRVWDLKSGGCRKIHHISRPIRGLAFEAANGSQFPKLTVQVIPTAVSSEVSSQDADSQDYRISPDTNWVTKGSTRMVWLPPRYRPNASAVFGRSIAVGCTSGQVYIMHFSENCVVRV
ncbi:uncharacterized protein TrAtP1_012386 [Trichoderma atroviride]|uniref:uncharacterized protein n=1 Tax=Hypocrea atroviridis TaxID=63577 RepID=UPI00331D8352|nr:hypothetical protein TrAtP1_012386 [Trichoderma atroviride]